MSDPHAAAGRYDVAVVTTAALPWRTGPAYFSIWHAGGLKALGLRVVYVVPWVEPEGQRLWGGPIHAAFEDHAAALHEEAARIGCPPLPTIVPYPARVWGLARSIVPRGDVFAAVPPADALVLHEPEHLAWAPWTRPRRRLDARRVVGVVMTNYEDYIRSAHQHRRLPLALTDRAARLATRYHRSRIARQVDVAVPLSGAVEGVTDVAGRQRRAQVTGVAAPWAEVPPVTPETRGVYFLGRLIWEKGLGDLIEIARRTGLPVDVIGEGGDGEAIRERARTAGAPLRFHGASGEPWTLIGPHRVFLNPSRSEVLCTTTAEALAAGRHVVIPDCPANAPFAAYPNAHLYRDLDGAVAALARVMETPPAAPDAARRAFDWMQACRTVAGLCGFEEAARSPGR